MSAATPAYRWRLVPVLTCARFVSGAYTEAVIVVMSYGGANPYLFAFFGSLSLGLWRPYFSNWSRLPAEATGGRTFAPRPERITYYANYAREPAGGDNLAVTVHIPVPER